MCHELPLTPNNLFWCVILLNIELCNTWKLIRKFFIYFHWKPRTLYWTSRLTLYSLYKFLFLKYFLKIETKKKKKIGVIMFSESTVKFLSHSSLVIYKYDLRNLQNEITAHLFEPVSYELFARFFKLFTPCDTWAKYLNDWLLYWLEEEVSIH